MSVSGTSLNQLTDLASALMQRFDANADGKLSGEEFGALLGQLLAGAAPSGAGPSLSGAPAGRVAPSAVEVSAQGRQRLGEFAGFDMAKLDNLDWGSFKYRIGRILQHYPNTTEGLRQALPEIRQIVPGATIAGAMGDKIDFGTYQDPKSGLIGVVDVILAAGGPEGGRAWTWQPVESDGSKL
ncbi:MAG: hypothetical protein AB1806_01510 [Acidobacteriota bacterium]